MKIAVMQPAFVPPAGYLRLFMAADLFVFLDDAQFNRRWYTHRQQLTKYDGTKDWLTLPVKKSGRDDTMIRDMQWQEDAITKLSDEERRFPVFKTMTLASPPLFMLSPMAFIIAQLDECLQRLAIPFPRVTLASSVPNPKKLKGQDRILSICESAGATEYINSPGGKDLYDEEAFSQKSTKLTFLGDYRGDNSSIIERLAKESPQEITKEMMDNI